VNTKWRTLQRAEKSKKRNFAIIAIKINQLNFLKRANVLIATLKRPSLNAATNVETHL